MNAIHDVEQMFVSPTLGKRFCLYFLLMTIISLIIMVLVFINAGYDIFKSKGRIIFPTLLLPLIAAELYFNNRIIYSMCYQSLN